MLHLFGNHSGPLRTQSRNLSTAFCNRYYNMGNIQDESSHRRFSDLPLSTSGPIDCSLSGVALLRSPYLNKGTAFSRDERNKFGLNGTLPTNIQSLDQQVRRAYDQYSSRPSALAKNTFMTSLKEQNEVLYYALLLRHLKEMFSVIYTPTEGEAIADYSRLFRRPEGCFLSIDDPDGTKPALSSWGGAEDIDLIVVSDAEQILGMGDQGVGGILISVAKLIIYTACAGVHPHRTLPVILDCGTDNKQLLDDELYLGNKHDRIRGDRYNTFIYNFITTARTLYPRSYIHCEDFGISNARRILDEYRDKVPIFNDDVQGTGCVTLAAIKSALKIAKLHIKDARVLCYGAGTAGTGIADMICQAIAVESEKSKEDAASQIYCVDEPGLLTTSRTRNLTHAQKAYARDSNALPKNLDTTNLQSLVNHIKPHILVGTSTQPGAFDEGVVRTMTRHVERPIIFPLSNPTRLHEAIPQDLLDWTDAKALVATGSPFDPVTVMVSSGSETTFEISECNNSTVFPGIGLGGILSRARLVTDKMLVAATEAVAAEAPAMKGTQDGKTEPDARKGLLPDVADVREVSVKVAVVVVRAAVEEGVAEEKLIPMNEKDEKKQLAENKVLEEWVREQMWEAKYRPLRKVTHFEADKLGRGEAGAARHASQHL